jgi:prepilin-type N-terminal cleavage/methylation domain-containing protein
MKKHFREAGFKLIEIMVVVAVIGLLAVIAIPNLVRARATSQAHACIHNLKQIDVAANQFSMDHSLPAGSTITYPDDLTSYIKLNANNKILGCPAGGTYDIAGIGALPTCSLGTTVTPNHVLP